MDDGDGKDQDQPEPERREPFGDGWFDDLLAWMRQPGGQLWWPGSYEARIRGLHVN